MPATSILIKLASSACNINCSYFFYKKLSAKRDEEFLSMMNKVKYNIVSVVTSYSVKKTKYIYNFFKEKGFQFQQYIPCLDDSDTKSEWSLDANTYGEFLCELFDIWYDDYVHGGNIDIRMFSNWVQMAAGYMP